jgi:hypothetical protein
MSVDWPNTPSYALTQLCERPPTFWSACAAWRAVHWWLEMKLMSIAHWFVVNQETR